MLLSAGCAAQPTNPRYSLSVADAQHDLSRIERDARPLPRPLLVIGGFMDPGVAAISLRDRFKSLAGDSRIVTISLGECSSFEECRRKIVSAVQRTFPCANPFETTEMDVIGYSMGGLAARYAALPSCDPSRRRLRIVRLFTISTPHRGAEDARRYPLLFALQADLRPGSALLAKVNAAKLDYPIIAYARLGDRGIGVENEAPPGQTPWWVPTPPLNDPHLSAFSDPRFLDDIARRLRGETPATVGDPTPLPDSR